MQGFEIKFPRCSRRLWRRALSEEASLLHPASMYKVRSDSISCRSVLVLVVTRGKSSSIAVAGATKRLVCLHDTTYRCWTGSWGPLGSTEYYPGRSRHLQLNVWGVSVIIVVRPHGLRYLL
jgi:hypothetical protein